MRKGFGQPTEDFGHEILKYGGVEGVDLELAAALHTHEIRQFEDGEVMRQGGRLQTRRTGQVAGRPLPTSQHTKNGTAMGIGQSAVRRLQPALLSVIKQFLKS